MSATAGRKGPSAKPTAKRARAKPAGDLTKGNRIVGIDQPSLYHQSLFTSYEREDVHHNRDDDSRLVLGEDK